MTTVQQLIDMLASHPPDSRVLVYDYENHEHLDNDIRLYPVGVYAGTNLGVADPQDIGLDVETIPVLTSDGVVQMRNP